jgi:hypothetical protein
MAPLARGPASRNVSCRSPVSQRGRNVKNLSLGKHLLVEVAPGLLDSDTTGMWLLMADLQYALRYLDKKNAPRRAATFPTVQRHARHTYDELVGLLPRLTISDDNRRQLEAQLSVLKARLILSGEVIPS